MIEFIHVQLSAWGRRTVRQSSKGIGYAASCPMFNERFGGEFASRPPTGVEVTGCDSLHDVDRAVAMLDTDGRTMVFEFYVKNATATAIAERLGVSRKTFYDRLHALQQKVLHNMQDIELAA